MKKMFLLSALFCSTLLLAEPKYGGVLVFGRSGDSSTLDPAQASDGETFYATTEIYDCLVQFKLGSTEIEPGLAESWEISEDGLHYTFHLRKGVYFAPTKYFNKKVEFTADDVIFSLKRQYDKTNPYNKIGRAFEYWESMDMSKIIKDIVKVDKYTVRFDLQRKEAPFLANLAMDFAGILSKQYADELLKEGRPDDINRLPVGTGPFIFQSWKRDERIVFKANENYWNGRPYLDRLILKVIPNNSVRAAELKSGQIQVMDFPNPAEVKGLEDNPNVTLIKSEGLNVGYLALNTQNPYLKNLKVREAINYAINKEAIVDAIYEGLGKAAYAPIPPTMWSFNDNIAKLKYNPEKAKELLKEAGYESGFDINLWAMPVPRPYIPDAKKVAEAMQADLAKVGIRAKIVTYDWVTYLDKSKKGEHDMLLMGWTGDNGDPDNFLNVLLSKKAADLPIANFARWKNDEFDSIVQEARTTIEHEKRVELYKQAQEIFAKDVPWVTIANSVVVVPVLNKVKNFKIDPTGKRRFKKVWLEK